MRNLWIQTDNPFATWVADLSALRGRPAALLDLVEVVLEAGAKHQVFVPVELPALGYSGAGGTSPMTEVRDRWRDQRIVDLFGFTGAAMKPSAPGSSTVEATLAWFDAADALVEAPVLDLGAVLRALEPTPGSIPDGFTAHYPALRITGPQLQYGAGDAPIGPSERRAAHIRFAIHSDIWFPFVFGSAHPEADHRRMFDNHALAARHTPRLNQFLIEVGAAVRAAKGTWAVDLDETGTNAALWLDEQGILVEAPAPDLMPAEALAAEWY